ncbi:hypothetical protein, partial [Escherichia coli]|uniref:hypothetical protein n=1 Tax=Escherichia coli TaxID=562 RepID=UPI003CE47C3D
CRELHDFVKRPRRPLLRLQSIGSRDYSWGTIRHGVFRIRTGRATAGAGLMTADGTIPCTPARPGS